MEVEISTVYALAMPKYVYVQVKDVQQPAKIQADKVEKTKGLLLLKRGSEQVGEFLPGVVQGWWIQDEEK